LKSQSELLKGIQEKRIESFEDLYHLYFADLVVFAQSYVYQQDIAEDMVQECIFQLWDSKTSLGINKSVKSYLYSSVRNKCLNHLRRLQVEDKYRQKEMQAISLMGNYELVDDEELIEKVKAAIDQLPEKCRETFKMSVIQDMKYKEIAEELDVSINTVKDQIKRAYRFLREHRFDDYLKVLVFLMLR
jgi:RNA polymerase sigma-70 factor (ECF subfamily)